MVSVSPDQLSRSGGEPDPARTSPAVANGRPQPAGDTVDDGTEFAELRRQAHQLVAETTGALRRIHLRRGDTVLEIEWQPATTGQEGTTGSTPVAAPQVPGVPAQTGPPGQDADVRRIVSAPLVGTFYRAPEPGGPPFVEVGDKVEAGQVVCIVEAMKLMNEVVAGQAGRVVEVVARDGEPVEFGQPLMALLPV